MLKLKNNSGTKRLIFPVLYTLRQQRLLRRSLSIDKDNFYRNCRSAESLVRCSLTEDINSVIQRHSCFMFWDRTYCRKFPECECGCSNVKTNLNGGITVCLDTYYHINNVRQHNCFFITQVNYIGYMFRLMNSHLQAISLQVKSQGAVHTLGSQCVYISE